MKQNKKAFTLIELLVVVLIIGILAAIALPQYQVAVVKARVGTYLPLLKTIAEAEETHYLETQQYSHDTDALAIKIPPECTQTKDGNTYKCGDYFLLDFSHDERLLLTHCPGYNTRYSNCTNHADFSIQKGFQHTTYAGKWGCSVTSSSLGKRICKNFTF